LPISTEKLKTVASSQFDATYDSTQIQGHELSISATRTELASGSSTAVMNNASAYLPVAEKPGWLDRAWERITEEVVMYLRELTAEGARLHGASDPAFRTVRVLIE